jgi:opacity protein-like surface antigen
MKKNLLLVLTCFTLASNLAQASGYIGLSSGVIVNTSDSFEVYDHGVYHHQAINYRQVPLTLFGGYGFDLRGPFYFAGELFVTPTIGELNSSSFGDHLKMTYHYGLSFIPGMQISEQTIAYARLGWIGAHFENQNSQANGGQFGLGLKTSITQHLDLRAEYTVTSYLNSFKSADGSSSVNSDQFSFGLVYRFI